MGFVNLPNHVELRAGTFHASWQYVVCGHGLRSKGICHTELVQVSDHKIWYACYSPRQYYEPLFAFPMGNSYKQATRNNCTDIYKEA